MLENSILMVPTPYYKTKVKRYKYKRRKRINERTRWMNRMMLSIYVDNTKLYIGVILTPKKLILKDSFLLVHLVSEY